MSQIATLDFKKVFLKFHLSSNHFFVYVLFPGFSRYLNSVHDVNMPPTQFWYCSLSTTVLWVANLCSTLFILNMTFEHFYSIIRPHKAASFNTVKRTKLSIACSVIFSILYNIPHLYITFSEGRRCGPFGRAMKTNIEQFYYWFSLFINFALPFVLLLIMNCFIIHTIRQRPNIINTRSQSTLQGQGQSEGQGQASKIKSSEMQIFIILLLVTFGFLFLTTPAYVWFVYINFGNLLKSPKTYAGYRLFHSVAQKLYYTNYGINFYLYVISGKKFRGDLTELFVRNKTRQNYMAKSVKN